MPKTKFYVATIFFTAYLTFLSIALLSGDVYYKWWLPAFELEFQVLIPDFHVDSFELASRKGELSYVLSAKHRSLFRAHQPSQISSDSYAITCSTLAGHLLEPSIIVLSLISAFPGITLTRRLLALGVSLPLLALLHAVDIPIILAAAVEHSLHHQGIESTAFGKLLLLWAKLMEGGGRYALSIAVAAIAIAVAQSRQGRVLSNKSESG